MPISANHLVAISQWFMSHSPQAQVVHTNAHNLQGQTDAACENWAIRGLLGNMTTPVEVLSTIVMGGMEPGLQAVVNEVHGTFGRLDAYSTGPLTNANRAQRNQRRDDLHRLTAAVFEYCLVSNGFVLQDGSDYMVCMEYECSPKQAMYPNFTHAWLAYRAAFVVQTIPGCYISISLREAGRQPHCGFIRRGVADFLPGQIQIIEDIIDSPLQCINPVTECANPIGRDANVFSPNE